jgi:outer membrane protein OmpA-like peptidoglycan-associated protein/ABC-type taurine transport system substrate-binding protein
MAGVFSRLTIFGRIAITAGVIGALWAGKVFLFDKGPLGKMAKDAVAAAPVDPNAPLPTTSPDQESNQINCRINVWVGCAPGLVANGGLDTTSGSIYANSGLKVSFKIIDDWTEGAAALATGNVDVMLTTADVWAKDQAKLEEKGFSGRAFFMVDWSRGADGVIASQGINDIEGLAGKTIAFAPYTPSHFLLWNGLKNSGLSTTQRNEIMAKAIHTKDGIEPATLFAQQKIDAAVAWEPDMSDAVGKRPGSKKIYDTKIASKLIADILVVSDSFAAKNPHTLIKFVEGWLKGVETIKEQPARAYNLLGSIKDMNIPADLAKTMLEGVYLSDYASNLDFFNARGGAESDYAIIMRGAQEMYKEDRIIKKLTDPKPTMDTRYLAALEGKFSKTSTEAPVEYKAPSKGAAPFATQRRTIYFESGSAVISPDSKPVVDEIGNFMRSYENTVVSIEGNTDSNGTRALNMRLSKERADSVKNYLVQKFGFKPQRMQTVGNGPDKAVDTNSTPEGREKNRRTDIKVYANQ